MGAGRAAEGTGGPPLSAGLLRTLRGVLWWARGVLGGHAYDQYLAHHRRRGHPGPPMTEREFWRARTDHQERHPEGRCC